MVSADQDDISSVLFLVSTRPVAFPPTEWQKPQTAADLQRLARRACWEMVFISSEWAERLEIVQPSTKHKRYLPQLSDYCAALIISYSAGLFRDCPANPSVAVWMGLTQKHRSLMNKWMWTQWAAAKTKYPNRVSLHPACGKRHIQIMQIYVWECRSSFLG